MGPFESSFTRFSRRPIPDFQSRPIAKMPTTVYKCIITDQEVFTQYAKSELIDDMYYKLTGVMKQEQVIEVNTGQNPSEEEEQDDAEQAMPPTNSLATACRLQNVSHNLTGSAKTDKALFAKKPELKAQLKEKLPKYLKEVVMDQIKKSEFNFYSTEGDDLDLEGILIPCLEYGDKEGDKVEMFVWKWAVYEDKY